MLTALCCVVSGCGDSDSLGRRAVSGSVTFHGQPLDYGAIRFEPKDQDQGVGGGAVIEAGKYYIDQELGLPPGSYKVWITASGTANEAPVEEAPGETPRNLAKERIPPQYNVNTQLVAEVTAAGDTEFNFDLK
jgi:hypothetical protein